jgi:hypothetical protein
MLFARAQELDTAGQPEDMDVQRTSIHTSSDRYGGKVVKIHAIQDGQEIEALWSHRRMSGTNFLRRDVTALETGISHDVGINLGDSRGDTGSVSAWEGNHTIPLGHVTAMRGEAIPQNAAEILGWMRSRIVEAELEQLV